MIVITPRKRLIHPQLLRISRIDDDNIDNINAFEDLYGEYKNLYGKISAYEYICKDKQIDSLLTASKEEIKQFVLTKIYEIQGKARDLNISSKIYNYLSDEQINETALYIDQSKSPEDAINYLYQACLYGNGMDVKFSRGRKRNR